MQSISVRKKLFIAIFGPSFGFLLILGLAGLWLDVIALRKEIETEARSQAQLISLLLRAPIGATDDAVIGQVLDSLEGDPDIAFGVLYSPADKVVASYPAGKAGFLLSQNEERESGIMTVRERIMVGDEKIGSFLLGVSLDRYEDRLRWYVAGAALSIAVLTAIAALVASKLQRQLSQPLSVLADTAESISRKRDYSVRVPDVREREFQALTSAFNHMLFEIQSQTSALTEANTQLRNANAELEAFTYSVSHDLRTPLRAISGYSQVLQSMDENQISGEAADYLARIESNAIRMAELIDDLLAFSRVDAHPLAREEVRLDPMVEEIWSELKAQNSKRDLTLKAGKLGTVRADPSLLRQVLTNLLHNAVKYTRGKDRAEIEVGTADHEGAKAFFVRDNGAGFDMKYASKLFGLFHRLHSQKDFEGTGIGLAIVQRIVLRHGGKVWAFGEPGKGATFYFTLS